VQAKFNRIGSMDAQGNIEVLIKYLKINLFHFVESHISINHGDDQNKHFMNIEHYVCMYDVTLSHYCIELIYFLTGKMRSQFYILYI
jgi:hypothetical protein